MSYPNRCLATGCTRPRYAYGLCKPHHERLERHGDPMPEVAIGRFRPKGRRPYDRAMDGPFYCTCPTSRPNGLGACVDCGYVTVATMDHRSREESYVAVPWLRHQRVEPVT